MFSGLTLVGIPSSAQVSTSPNKSVCRDGSKPAEQHDGGSAHLSLSRSFYLIGKSIGNPNQVKLSRSKCFVFATQSE